MFYEKARAKKHDEDEKKLKAVKAEIIKTRKRIDELEEAEASYGEKRNSIDDFIANANRLIDIQELTPGIVHAFITKIYVYE